VTAAQSLTVTNMPPIGFQRSRALWEQARENGSGKQGLISLFRAILYELQPVRYSEWSRWTDQITAVTGRFVQWCRRVLHPVALTVEASSLVRTVVHFLSNLSLRQWRMVALALAYYLLVRWLHAALDAGPLVLIISALVAIFTIGLSDNNDGSLSAYSVFNKGFQKLLGSIDEEALLQQHVGGGMLMGGGGMMLPPNDDENENDERGDADHRRPNNVRPLPDQGPADEAIPPAAAAAAAPQHRARRTGKKARRDAAHGNLAQRRELQAQRQAARALGLVGDNDELDEAALLRLLDREGD
jgi:Uncharacterized conserved domain (SAYSvFN)